mgnify:CR=1 FL=1
MLFLRLILLCKNKMSTLPTIKVPVPAVFRQNVAETMISPHLRRMCTFSCLPAVLENWATNLERGIYNFSLQKSTKLGVLKTWANPQFIQIYVNRLHTILTYVNSSHLNRIQTHAIWPHEIAFMSMGQLDPVVEAFLEQQYRKEQRTIEQQQSALIKTNQFTCRRCKGNECSYSMQQTRSADEPMTVFIICIGCGNRWKK